MILEIIATTLKEAIDIEKAGANRIELVTGIKEGGLTPSLGLIELVTKSVKIPVNVMVRPHSKSFYYDENDFEVILKDIKMIRNTKANGIVFGSLNIDKTINFGQLEEVINAKGDLKLTFHRAIDETVNILDELDKLIKFKIDIILTSAGKNTVLEDIDTLNKIQKMAASRGITILAGAGLKPDNVHIIKEKTNIKEVHMGSGVKFNNDNFSEIDQDKIKYTLKVLGEK